jgi:hypothetical protein
MAEGKAAALPAPKAAVKLSARPAPRSLPKGGSGSARMLPRSKTAAATAGGEDHWKEF